MRGRKVYTFGDISGIDPINDRIPILDMNQSGEARDKLVSPAALLSGVSIDTSGFVTTGQTGDFYPRSNPSGYITGQDLSAYSTNTYVTGISGVLQDQISTLENLTGDYYLNSNPSGFVTTGQTGLFAPISNPVFSGNVSIPGVGLEIRDDGGIIGIYFGNSISSRTLLRSHPGLGFGSIQVTLPETQGELISNGDIGTVTDVMLAEDYYLRSNPSGYITGQDLSNYSTNSYTTGISGVLQSQITNLSNQTGNYYSNTNPSGFITGDLSLYGTLVYINSVSGNLQSQIGSSSQDGRSLLNFYWK